MTRHLHMNNVHPFPTFDRYDFAEPSVPRPDLDEQLCEAEYLQEDGRHSRLSSLRDRAASRLAALRFNPGRVVAHIPALVFGFIAGLAAIAIPAIVLTHGAIL